MRLKPTTKTVTRDLSAEITAVDIRKKFRLPIDTKLTFVAEDLRCDMTSDAVLVAKRTEQVVS